MDFQGFQNSLPEIVIVIAVVALLFISWFSYRKVRNIPPLSRYLLMGLRASALIIILFLLMNPYFYSSREVDVKSKIAVFLDNSESVGIERGDYSGRESYNALLNRLNFRSQDQIEVEYYSIGESTTSFSPDSLNLSAPLTNLSNAVSTILEMEEDVKAAVIISDGIITYGKNPVFNASSSSIPLHTIALGDTSKVRDISVSNVITNSTGYTNTKHFIEAEISQTGFQGSTVEISLVSGDTVIQNKQLDFDTDDQIKNVEFELELEEEGLKQYEIQTETIADEWSHSNNTKEFSIDVLDSKVKILHVAFEIHPDVKTIRSIINEDINNELYTLTWLGGNNFVEELPEEMDYDLIILHGSPDGNTNLNFLEVASETPFLLFNTTVANPHPFIEDLKLIDNTENRVVNIHLNKLLNADEQPILELPEFNLSDAPTLLSPLRTSSPDVQSINLFSLTYNNNTTNYPAITILEQGNLRRAHIYPWGWYKMYQSTNQVHREFTTELIANLVSWTSSDPDSRNLQVAPSKRTFTTVESPVIQASLQNESGEMESGAILEVEIFLDDNTSRSFNMENLGNGNYSLDLPQLSEGLYEFEATARKGNRTIDSRQGEFLVSNSSSELSNTKRNDQLLQSLSANTGGYFFEYSNTEGFWDSLRTTQIFESQTQTIENYAFPVRSVFWFILVIVLLTAEWLSRKYYSLP